MSIRSITITDSLRADPIFAATLDLEQQVSLLDDSLRPLRKAQKKLLKVENELTNINSLIDSGIGSKADKAALRKNKKELRARRVQLWEQLSVLPRLEEERQDLLHELDVLRRRHGVL